jgi:putative ABC transport system permease protein
LRALGAQSDQVRAMVVGEAGVVAICGIVAGIVVGTAMGLLFVRILRPLFLLDPGATFPSVEIAALAGLVVAVAAAVASIASALLRRLAPSELLRET